MSLLMGVLGFHGSDLVDVGRILCRWLSHSFWTGEDDAASSGLSLVGLSKTHYLPIKECPKCQKKVNVGPDKICPSCSAYFTYWD